MPGKRLPLLIGRLESVFETLANFHSYALWGVDIVLYGFKRYRPYRRYEFAASPETGGAFFHPRKFCSNGVRRVALDLPDDGDNADARINVKKQVDMIGHDLYAQNGIAVVALLLDYQLFEPLVQRWIEHSASGPRSKDDGTDNCTGSSDRNGTVFQQFV